MALYRKGQVPGYRETYREMTGQGWYASAARYAMHGGEPVIYIDADTPYTWEGEKVKSRCWTGSGIEDRKGMDVMLYVERGGEAHNLEDLNEKLHGTRDFTVRQGDNAIGHREAADAASRFSGAASYHPFVCSLEDYRLTYAKKEDLMRQLGGSPDPDKGYATYLDHCVRDLRSGDVTYIGAIRTERQVKSLLDEHMQYMDMKSGDGPVFEDAQEEAMQP